MLSIYLSMVETDEERDLVTRIYTHFERMMYKIALGILKNPQDAEDAVSEAFIRIIKNLDKISGLDKEKCKGFVIIVIRNVAIDMYKKRKKKTSIWILTMLMTSAAAMLRMIFWTSTILK